MKNILLIIALFAFLNSYATDPLSWGKKGGSGGVTQSQLDKKADTSQILAGQEALDTLSSMISQTFYGGSDLMRISNAIGGKALYGTMSFLFPVRTSTYTYLSGSAHFSKLPIDKDSVIKTLKVDITTVGNYTEDEFNGLALFKLNATKDSIIQVGITANSSAPFETGAGFYGSDLTSTYSAKRGEVLYIGSLNHFTAGTGAVVRVGYFDSDPTGHSTACGYYVGSQTAFASKYALADLISSHGYSIIGVAYGE